MAAPPRPATLRRGFVLALACALIWGSQFPVAKTAYAVVDVFHVNAVRYGGAVILLLPLLAWREGLAALRYDGHGRAVSLAGIIGLGCSPSLVYGGLSLTRPEIVAIIVATQPAMTALALWVLRGQRPARFTLATIALAFFGVVTVVTGWQLHFLADAREVLGSILVIIGGGSWVYYTIQIDTSADHANSMIELIEFPALDQYEAEVTNFSRVIRGEDAPYYGLDDARANAAVADAVFASAQSGSWAMVARAPGT